MSVGPRSWGAIGPSTVCTPSPCWAARLAGVMALHRTPPPCGPSMLRTDLARGPLRTRSILDDDFDATGAVNVEEPRTRARDQLPHP